MICTIVGESIIYFFAKEMWNLSFGVIVDCYCEVAKDIFNITLAIYLIAALICLIQKIIAVPNQEIGSLLMLGN